MRAINDSSAHQKTLKFAYKSNPLLKPLYAPGPSTLRILNDFIEKSAEPPRAGNFKHFVTKPSSLLTERTKIILLKKDIV